MATCPTCENNVGPNVEQCHFCGRIFHETHNLVLKSNGKKNAKKVTVMQRVLAGTVDILFAGVAILISVLFLDKPIEETTVSTFLTQSWIIILAFASLQLFLLVHDGQSVGKKLMKIAIVVNDTNDHPSAFQLVVLRCAVPLIPFALPHLGLALFALNLAWGLGDEQRCLHDFIAGTTVVHE